MLKRILLASCFSLINISAQAEPISPLGLFTEQCLSFTPKLTALFDVNNSIDIQAQQLEQTLIGLHNLNDRISYYRSLSLSLPQQEGLLQCQLHIADEMADVLNSNGLQQFIVNGRNNRNRDINKLAQRWLQLTQLKFDQTQKSQLHTSQATTKQNLNNQDLSLTFNNPQCRIENSNNKAQAFDQNIALYLLKQTNADCRRQVWLAFQARAVVKNKQPIENIINLRQQHAKQAGFANFAIQQLSLQQLNTPELVQQFLDSQTHKLTTTPWDIGQDIKALGHPKFKLNQQQLLNSSQQLLNNFGLSFEQVTSQTLRVYLDQRLLGNISLFDSNKIRMAKLKQTVVGVQFGQIALSLPKQFKHGRQIKQYSDALAQAIVSLARGGHYYLNNSLGDTQDSSHIAELWLSQYINYQLQQDFQLPKNPRLAYIQAYQQQLNVFRAKVALNVYQNLPDNRLKSAFSQSFSGTWPMPQAYRYSYNAIAFDGPLFYQALWQQALADLLFQHSQQCHDPMRFFTLLVVNEQQESLTTQLQLLLGGNVTAASLIRRISHAQHKYPITCSVNHINEHDSSSK